MQKTLEDLMRTGWKEKPPEPLNITIENRTPVSAIRVEFDGGARFLQGVIGFGMGYGSFRYIGGKPVRCEFNRVMSANAAEIWTVSAALHRMSQEWEPGELDLDIWGDSTIAIKWILVQAREKATVPFQGKTTLSKGSSQEMKDAIASLEICREFKSITATWHSRKNSVQAFGH